MQYTYYFDQNSTTTKPINLHTLPGLAMLSMQSNVKTSKACKAMLSMQTKAHKALWSLIMPQS